MARYIKSGSVSTVPEINSELEKIATAQTEFLSRSGEAPNEMLNTLDMNNNRITNLSAPTNGSDAARFADVVGGVFTVLTDEALVFDNILEMTTANLVVGQYVRCKKYYSGGELIDGLVFIVVAGGTGVADGGSLHDNVNGTQAQLFRNANLNLLTFGVSGASPSFDTTAFFNAVTYAKQSGVVKIIIPDFRVSLICNEVGGSLSFAAALVIDGLNNCSFEGAGPNSELFAATGGTGTNTFSLLRIQNCNNLTFKNFKVEGDYTNHVGSGGSRSKFVWITTFDRNNPEVDLSEIHGLSFENIECNDIGGFIGVARRGVGAPYAPNIFNVNINDCFGLDSAQNDNVIGLNFTKGGSIKRNRFVNTAVQNPPPVLFVDCSRGCENIDVENNYAERFVFGAKSESATASEVPAPSKNINFISNRFIQTGDPDSLTGGEGGLAGATYAIKIRSENSLVKNNYWTARTDLVTSGGLNTGILIAMSDITSGVVTVNDGNNGVGSEFGIIHNNIVTDSGTKCIIEGNTIYANQVGILAQKDCDVLNNDVFETSSHAVNLQLADNTRALKNKAFNCGSPSDAVYYQGDGGSGTAAGYFEFIGNEIHDDRGASAATNGYSLQAGLVYTNQYKLKEGYTSGLLGDVFEGDYIGLFDFSDIKYSGQVNSALAVTNGFNIANVTLFDANTIQINFKREIPSDITPAPNCVFNSAGNFFVPFGSTTTYFRLRFVDSVGALKTPQTFNIKG